MNVTAIMTRDVATIDRGATVREAARLLEDLSIRHLPVVDDGRLVGILSDRDLREYRLPLMEEIEDPDLADSLGQTKVAEAMREGVVCLEEHESLRQAVDVMVSYGVGAVPVLAKGTSTVVGIVSYVDVLRAVGTMMDRSEV